MFRPKAILLATSIVLMAAGAGWADTPAGVATAVNPQASTTSPSAPTRVLEVGANLVMNEKVETGAEGQTQLLFRDGSSVTVGPGAELTIDSFVYDPSTRTAKLAMSAASGLLRFVGGRASKDGGDVSITTPAATVGIRGGIVDISHDKSKGTTTAQFLFGRGMDIKSGNDTQTITSVGFGVTVGSDGKISQPFLVTLKNLTQTNSRIEGHVSNVVQSSAPSAIDSSAQNLANINSSITPNVQPTNINPSYSGQSNGLSNIINQTTSTIAQQITQSRSDGINLPDGYYNRARLGNQGGYLNPGNAINRQFTISYNGYFGLEDTSFLSFSSGNLVSDQGSEITKIYGNGTLYPVTDITTDTWTINYTNMITKAISVDNAITLGVLTKGAIDYNEIYVDPQNPSNNYTSTLHYQLTPQESVPIVIGTPVDPSVFPTSALWTYNLTGSTPAYFSDAHALGTLVSGTVVVLFVPRVAQTNFQNLAAAINLSISVEGYTLNASTTAAPTLSALSQAASSGTGALFGTKTGNLFGNINVLSTNQGKFCNAACTGAISGFFAGKTGGQIGLVYQIPAITQPGQLYISGGASFTHH